MLTQTQFYFDVVQAYFGTAVAILFIIQPVTIPLSSLFHALEVQARLRGWSRVQPVAYWLAKTFGTCAAIDLRNIQRVGGKFFTIAWEVLTKIIAAWPASKASKNKAVIDAMKDSSRTLLVLLALSSVLPLQGCAWFRTAVSASQAACQAELASVPEVITEAQVRGVSVGQLVDAFCGLADVAAIFTTEAKPGITRTAMLPRGQAVALLRAKGEIE